MCPNLKYDDKPLYCVTITGPKWDWPVINFYVFKLFSKLFFYFVRQSFFDFMVYGKIILLLKKSTTSKNNKYAIFPHGNLFILKSRWKLIHCSSCTFSLRIGRIFGNKCSISSATSFSWDGSSLLCSSGNKVFLAEPCILRLLSFLFSYWMGYHYIQIDLR